MTNRRLAQLGVSLCLGSIIGLAFALPWLITNLRARNVTTMRLVGQFEEPSFNLNGEPFSVIRVPSFEDEKEGDTPVLRLTWRGMTHDFPMGEDEKRFQPGLKQHALWFGVLLLADGAATREELEQMWATDDGTEPYFVAVARYPAPGYEDGAWEVVRRQEWVYEFVKMNLEGPPENAIEVSRKNYEQVDALHLPGKYTPEEYIPSDEVRERDLWQYYAMLYVTPPEQVRGRNKIIDPLMREMGLAWPAAGVSMLGIVLGILLFGMSRRGREETMLTG